jgi:hypothetical protein
VDIFQLHCLRRGLFGIVVLCDWQVCAQFRTRAHHVGLSVAHWACWRLPSPSLMKGTSSMTKTLAAPAFGLAALVATAGPPRRSRPTS